MNLNSVKTVAPNRNLFKKMLAVVISVLVFVISFVVILNANNAAKDTVEVLRIKSEDGISGDIVITERNIEKYDLIRKEFVEDMILASEMPNVINRYIKYYLRKGSILHKDQLIGDKPLKNEWLYRMGEELEVITIPYNYLECGGDILTPGDRIRVRAIYEGTGGGTALGDNPNMPFFEGSKTSSVDVVFESIVVRDMLNSNSNSIYEVYKEVIKLPEDKKQAAMKSSEFMKSILPKSLILEGNREQINTYAKFRGLSGSKSFVITILSRTNSNIILDQLPTLKNEVETWIEKQK